MPSLSVVHVVPSMRRNDAPALSSPPKPSDPSRRPSTNHLNPTGTSTRRRPNPAVTRSIMPLLTTVLPTAASVDHWLSMREQVRNRDGQVVIGIHQSRRRRDDAVAIVVGVVGEGDVEAIAHRHERHHGVRRRAVRPNLAVPVHGHEAERRIDRVVHHGHRDPVPRDDRLPVAHAGAAERIHADSHAGAADGLHVDDAREVVDIRRDVVVEMRARRAARALVGHAADGAQVFSQERVRGLLDPAGDVGVGRAAGGRIVFEAAVFGRVVRGRDDDPVGQPGRAAAVVAKDGVRDDRRRRVAAIPVDHHLDAVGGQHLEGARQRPARTARGCPSP